MAYIKRYYIPTIAPSFFSFHPLLYFPLSGLHSGIFYHYIEQTWRYYDSGNYTAVLGLDLGQLHKINT